MGISATPFVFYRSDVLDRGVKQLISQALESKAKAFQTRIEGVVQNYIYMQKHPQNQGKPARKLRMVDSKEETKPSTSEVISDISQLIPVPCSSSTGSYKYNLCIWKTQTNARVQLVSLCGLLNLYILHDDAQICTKLDMVFPSWPSTVSLSWYCLLVLYYGHTHEVVQ